MDNNLKIQSSERTFSKNKNIQELFKIEDYSFLNNPILQQGKDINLLSAYYNQKAGNSEFLEKISKLNKKFYKGSEKYLKFKKTVEKLNDDLYLNLFQQIDYYVEEIEKLNKKISLYNTQELKKKIDQLNKEISEKNEKIRNCEKKIKEKTNIEEKLKKEIESYKRSIIFYKDKINIGILARNRNKISSYGRGSKSQKKQMNSPSQPEKNNNLSHKDNYNKDLIYDNENNNKDNEIKINRKYKVKESIFKFDRDINTLANRTDYDVDAKDIVERHHSSDKIKVYNENDDIFPDEFSQKFSEGFLKDLNEELYGSQNNNKNTIGKDPYNHSDFFSKISSDVISDTKYSHEIGNERKVKWEIDKKDSAKTDIIKSETKGRSTTYKTKNLKKPTKSNIKSKIFNKKINKTSLKDENENTNKKKQVKTTTKSRPKNIYRSNEKISNISEIPNPHSKKKFRKIIEKEKDIKGTSIKTQSNIESNPTQKYNTNTVPNYKSDSKFKKIEVNQTHKKENENINILNKKSNLYKKKDSYSNNSMLNLNVVKKNNDSSNINKKLNEKENTKELPSVIKDVNDDYLKSIELLRKQEEQIKYMLRFIELDDEE